MKLAIIGTTGLIGQACIKQLLQLPEVHSIYSLSRRPLGLQHEKLEERIDPSFDVETMCQGIVVDAAISCFGTTMKQAKSRENFEAIDRDIPLRFARCMKSQGAKRFFMYSSNGASKLSVNFYLRTKGQLEHEIARLGFESVHIFRPSLLLGERKDKRMGESIAGFVLGGLGPMFPSWLMNYRPVAALRVAESIVQHLLHEEEKGLQFWENAVFHRGYRLPKKGQGPGFY